LQRLSRKKVFFYEYFINEKTDLTMMFLLFKEVPLVDARLFEKQAKPLERQMSGISPISTGSICHDLLSHKRGHLVITKIGTALPHHGPF
jgi:hypothetical protein